MHKSFRVNSERRNRQRLAVWNQEIRICHHSNKIQRFTWRFGSLWLCVFVCGREYFVTLCAQNSMCSACFAISVCLFIFLVNHFNFFSFIHSRTLFFTGARCVTHCLLPVCRQFALKASQSFRKCFLLLFLNDFFFCKWFTFLHMSSDHKQGGSE